MGRERFCTVTRVAPDRALTAAHCVLDIRTGRPHRAEDIVLRLRPAIGRAAVTRGARSVALARPPVERAGREALLAQVARDVAWLMRDRPVRQPGLSPIPVAPAGAGVPHRLIVVSHARGREAAAALQDDGLLIDTRRDGALVLDGEVDPGASGAPVLEGTGPEPRIVAVISARGRMAQPGFPAADVALAAPVSRPGRGAAVPGPSGFALPSGPAGATPAPAGGRHIRRAGMAEAPRAAGPRVVRAPVSPAPAIP